MLTTQETTKKYGNYKEIETAVMELQTEIEMEA